MEKTLDVFDPNREALLAMVEKTKSIMTIDPANKEQIEMVHASRIELKKARVTIEKVGKAAREESQAYTKKVIAAEKELIEIIEPEEMRLKQLEEYVESLAIRAERMEKLPARHERLAAIGDGIEDDDEHLLTLDALAFESYFNARVASKNAADRAKAEADQRARDEEQRLENAKKEAELAKERKEIEDARLENEREATRLATEKATREREEAAREESRIRAENEARRAEEERIAREKRAIEYAAQMEADRIAAEKEEATKLAKRDEYKKFRAEHGWTEETKGDFKEEKTERAVILWKKVGTFEI